MFNEEVNGLDSNFYNINTGTIQGSILDPILCALFDLTDLSTLADDNFALTWHTCKQTVKIQMQIQTWTDYNLVERVRSKSKWSNCFIKKDTHPVEITLNDVIIKSIPHMNILGVCFDFKLAYVFMYSKSNQQRQHNSTPRNQVYKKNTSQAQKFCN